MTTFLFWNLRAKRLEAIIARLAARHAIDVFIFAECGVPERDMLEALNGDAPRRFRRARFVAFDCMDVYWRQESGRFGEVLLEADRYAIRRFASPSGVEILLAVAHLPILYKDSKDRDSLCYGLGDCIRSAERRARQDRTVLVGDLNVNPFQDGLLDARGLHAIGDRETVKRKDPRRFGTIRVEEFPFFYNPMWNHFGDGAPPAGTYYYDKSNAEVLCFWNIFDQVLIRRSLLDRFDHRTLKILTTDGRTKLITADGRPDAREASDHLPILFQLNLH